MADSTSATLVLKDGCVTLRRCPLPHTGLTAGCAPQDVVHWHVLRRQEEHCRRGGVSDRHGRLPAVAQRPIVQRTGASAMPLRSFQLGRGPLANAAPAQIVVLTYPLVGNYGVPDASLIDAYGTFFPRQRPLQLELADELGVQASSRMSSPTRFTSPPSWWAL